MRQGSNSSFRQDLTLRLLFSEKIGSNVNKHSFSRVKNLNYVSFRVLNLFSYFVLLNSKDEFQKEEDDRNEAKL